MQPSEQTHINRQICMDEQVYYDLKEGLLLRLKTMNQIQDDPWITVNEALDLLSITSQTTLKKFCDQGHIRVSKITEKIVLYDRQSILHFLESHVKNPTK